MATFDLIEINFNDVYRAYPEINLLGNGQPIENGDATPTSADQTALGSVAVGNEVVRTFTLNNVGTIPLILSNSPPVILIGSSDFTVTTQPDAIVAPNASTSFSIRFAPSTAGVHTAAVIIDTNDPNGSQYTFAIQGRAGPELDVQGNSLSIANGDSTPNSADNTDFGGIALQQGAQKAFALHNVGVTALTVNSIAFIGAHASDFSVVTPTSFPLTIAPGTSHVLIVQLQPTAHDMRTATLVVNSDDPFQPTYTFALQGGDVVCALFTNTTVVAIPDTTTITSILAIPDSFLVRDVNVRNLHLYHTFAADLVIDLINPTGMLVNLFNKSGGDGDHLLETTFDDAATTAIGNGSAPFTNAYRPATPLSAFSESNSQGTWRLQVADTAPADFGKLVGWSLELCYFVTPEIAVQGNGQVIASGDTTPSGDDQTDFGEVVAGSTVQRTFTIHNLGNADLQINGAPRVTMTGSPVFTVIEQPEATVAPNANTSFVVRFAPNAVALYTATVSIANSDLDEDPYIFTVAAGLALPPKPVTQWGTKGNGDGQFDTPAGSAVDSNGNVYVIDGKNHRVQKFDGSGAYLTQWGTQGNSDGQFNTPIGVAVDSSNNVYISDGKNHRIQKFDSNGTYLTQWGTEGGSDRQFRYPTGVTVDRSGNVYVSDTGNHRIQKFDSDGNFLEWSPRGRNASVANTLVSRTEKFGGSSKLVVQPAAKARAGVEFNYPMSIATDNNGNVYVVNVGDNQIQKFDRSGALLAQWGASGNGDGQFNWAGALAVDGSGNVYISDPFNNRIQKFDSNGVFLTQWGSAEGLAGQAGTPTGLGVDSSGNVFVTDGINHHVQKFGAPLPAPAMAVQGNAKNIRNGDNTPSSSDHTFFGTVALGGTIVRTFTIHNVGTMDLAVQSVTVNGSSAFQVSNAPATTVSIGGTTTFQVTFTPTTLDVVTATISIAGNDSNNNPYTFIVQGAGHEIVSTPAMAVQGNEKNIASGDSTPDSSDHTLFGSVILGGAIVRTFTINNVGMMDLSIQSVTVNGSNAFQVSSTPAMAVNAGGSTTFQLTFTPPNLDVVTATVSIASNASNENPYTFVIQGAGRELPPSYLTQWGANGDGNGQFGTAHSVAVDRNGAVYVADGKNHRIQKFASNGNLLAQWSLNSTGEQLFANHYGVAVDGSGNVYVIDTVNSRLQKFDDNGSVLAQWGESGSGIGQFSYPSGVAVDSSGNVYAADTVNQRIQKFDGDSNFIIQWGSQGINPGQFNSPAGLAVDSNGNVYVADSINNNIQKFDDDGNFLTRWGTSGSDDGQFNTPMGVAVDSNGNVYVDDRYNQRIQKFDSNGNFLTRWGTSGSNNGQFNNPVGVAVDSAGNVYVADTGNHRIQKFGLLPAEIEVQGNGVSITSGDSTPTTADHTDVGSVAVNSGTVVRTFTISNTGTGAALTLSGSPLVNVTGNSAFSISTQPASSSVAAGSSTTFQLTFAPTISGTITATVSIANNDSNETPYTFVVGGTATGQINRDNQVTQADYTAVYQATPQSCANQPVPGLPIHTLTPTLRNNTSNSYQGLYFVVTELGYTAAQGGNVPTLCNADGGNGGGVGARVTATAAGLSDGFNPNESFAQAFQVGLPVRARYRLFVNLYARPATVTAAEQGADDAANLIGVLGWEFDEKGNLITNRQVFLPLIAN